jgi:hypothetical protein
MTVIFEQKHFNTAIELGKVDYRGEGQEFFQSAMSFRDYLPNPSMLDTKMWSFYKGFANMLLPSQSNRKIPHTFTLDKERIIKLQSKLLDAVNLHLCTHFTQTLNTRHSNLPIEDVENSIRQAIAALHDGIPENCQWKQNRNNIALCIQHFIIDKPDLFPTIEEFIDLHISNTASDQFRNSELGLIRVLHQVLEETVGRYSDLTLNQLFELLMEPSSSNGNSLQQIANEIAHIGVLHWCVWDPLVYRNSFGEDME